MCAWSDNLSGISSFCPCHVMARQAALARINAIGFNGLMNHAEFYLLCNPTAYPFLSLSLWLVCLSVCLAMSLVGRPIEAALIDANCIERAGALAKKIHPQFLLGKRKGKRKGKGKGKGNYIIKWHCCRLSDAAQAPRHSPRISVCVCCSNGLERGRLWLRSGLVACGFFFYI